MLASLAWRRRGDALASGMGETSVALRRVEVHHATTVLLKLVTAEDLGEQIGRVVLGRYLLDDDDAGAAQLAHLEQLAIDVPCVLRRREAMTQVVSSLIIRGNIL